VVSIITDLISKKQVLQLNHSIKDSINTVKDELEDHLTAINENTNEIESNYELIAELAIKLEKIEERLEQVELILHSQDIEKQKVDELNHKEKSVFLTIYKQENDYLTYADLAALHDVSEATIRRYVDTQNKKGVPIIKKAMGGIIHFKLNPQFREMQTKHNLVNVRPTVTLDMFDQKIID